MFEDEMRTRYEMKSYECSAHVHLLRTGASDMHANTENQIGVIVVGDFCQYWNLNSQITDDFDILIMVSKAKFQKKLNGQTRFA